MRAWVAKGEELRLQLAQVERALPPLAGHQDLDDETAKRWGFLAAANWARASGSREPASLMAHLLVASSDEVVKDDTAWILLSQRCRKALGRTTFALWNRLEKHAPASFVAKSQEQIRRGMQAVLQMDSDEPWIRTLQSRLTKGVADVRLKQGLSLNEDEPQLLAAIGRPKVKRPKKRVRQEKK